ncbi:MAG: NAD(P)/FAD-dependent oxidoreductase, partial [Desulfomonilia bacterium]
RLHRVVIVGGGFGGLTAARSLEYLPVDVTLIDKRNFHLFQPLLYQVATGLLCPSEVTSPLRHILRKQKNVRVLLGEAVDFDIEHRRVILTDGEVDYDTLVVAAGMVNHYHGHDDWEQYAPGLKTIEDSGRMRQRIFYAFEVAEREPDPEVRKEWLTFVVIGSGPTGIELSGMLSEIARNTLKYEFRSIRPEESTIMLLDGAERILPSYPRRLSRITEQSLNHLGITTCAETMVVDISDRGVTVERPHGREFISARTVLWASGVKASPLGEKLAQKTGGRTDHQGRVMVNPDLTVSRRPEIFVIGDLGYSTGKRGHPLPGLAPVATQQGRYVSRLIRDRLGGKFRGKNFKYFDKGTLAVIGRHAAIADFHTVQFGGFFAWLLWLFIHLVLLIKFENRIIVMIRWAFQYISYNRGARNLSLQGTLRLPITGSRNRRS